MLFYGSFQPAKKCFCRGNVVLSDVRRHVLLGGITPSGDRTRALFIFVYVRKYYVFVGFNLTTLCWTVKRELLVFLNKGQVIKDQFLPAKREKDIKRCG